MGFAIQGRVEGLTELTAALKGLPDKIARKILRKALTRATKPVLMLAKKNAKQIADTGALAKSITRKTATYLDTGTIVAVIGPKTGATQMLVRKGRKKATRVNPAYYAHLVEFGTRPHAIGSKVSNLIRMHPGARARPFLRPAFEATKAQVVQIMGDEIAKGLFVLAQAPVPAR